MICTDINAGHEGPIGWDTGYVGELLDFAAVVVDGATPKATAADAVEDLRLMMAIMLSAKSGKWEVVAEVNPNCTMDTLQLDCATCM